MSNTFKKLAYGKPNLYIIKLDYIDVIFTSIEPCEHVGCISNKAELNVNPTIFS